MSTNWLLAETFGHSAPSIVAVGRSAKRFTPAHQLLRSSASKNAVRCAITDLTADPRPVKRFIGDGSRRVIAEPILAPARRIHGVWLWIGPADEDPPPHDQAGAWTYSLTNRTVQGSEDMARLLGSPRDCQAATAPASVFRRVRTDDDEGTVLAKIVRADPGNEHQSIWTIQKVDGTLRAAHISWRIVSDAVDADANRSGRTETSVRGIVHDLGPLEPASIVLKQTLEQRVLDALTSEGTYRALVDPRTLTLLRWYRSAPVPGLAWERTEGSPEPGVHPDDRRKARELLSKHDLHRSRGRLRFRATDGSWMPLDLDATTVCLDEQTTAALVTIARPSGHRRFREGTQQTR